MQILLIWDLLVSAFSICRKGIRLQYGWITWRNIAMPWNVWYKFHPFHPTLLWGQRRQFPAVLSKMLSCVHRGPAAATNANAEQTAKAAKEIGNHLDLSWSTWRRVITSNQNLANRIRGHQRLKFGNSKSSWKRVKAGSKASHLALGLPTVPCGTNTPSRSPRNWQNVAFKLRPSWECCQNMWPKVTAWTDSDVAVHSIQHRWEFDLQNARLP